MQFCDDCGSMMVSQDDEMVCTSCGATEEKEAGLVEEFTSTEEQTFGDVIESEGEDLEGKPTATDVTCDECGHGEAWYVIRQTASADEPPTRFFRCKECGNTWRGYN